MGRLRSATTRTDIDWPLQPWNGEGFPEYEYLTDEEKDIYRRGRNSKPHKKAKNASTIEYLEATGLEAVVGFLYLKGDMDRALNLIRLGLERNNLEL